MQLLKACTYHYFAAGSSKPHKAFLARLAASGACLILLLLLMVQITPEYIGLVFGQHKWQAYLLLINLAVSLTLVIAHNPYKSFMQRTSILSYVPLPRNHVMAYKLYAFTPLVLLTTCILFSLGLQLVGGNISLLVVATVAGVAVSVLPQALLRITGSGFSQAYSLAHVITTAYILNLLALGQIQLTSIVIICYLASVHGLIWLSAYRRNIHVIKTVSSGPKQAFRGITMRTSIATRALRSSRFITANILLGLMAVLLSVVSLTTNGKIPFDAVVLLLIVVLGTIAQEVRTLSLKYPTEHIFYGLVHQWHLAGWITAIATATLYGAGILLIGEIFFAGELSVSTAYVLAFLLSVISWGMVSSAVLVPDKDDILSQLASVMLYAVGMWGIYEVFADMSEQGLTVSVAAASAIFVGCYICSYAIEQQRWLKMIRGSHGRIFFTEKI